MVESARYKYLHDCVRRPLAYWDVHRILAYWDVQRLLVPFAILLLLAEFLFLFLTRFVLGAASDVDLVVFEDVPTEQ